MKDLQMQFHDEMLEKCAQAKKKYGYNPARFVHMVAKDGALQTVKKLMRKKELSEGFVKLQELGALELSMEASVIDSKYAELFTDEEVNYCFEQLCECGYFKL